MQSCLENSFVILSFPEIWSSKNGGGQKYRMQLDLRKGCVSRLNYVMCDVSLQRIVESGLIGYCEGSIRFCTVKCIAGKYIVA